MFFDLLPVQGRFIPVTMTTLASSEVSEDRESRVRNEYGKSSSGYNTYRYHWLLILYPCGLRWYPGPNYPSWSPGRGTRGSANQAPHTMAPLTSVTHGYGQNLIPCVQSLWSSGCSPSLPTVAHSYADVTANILDARCGLRWSLWVIPVISFVISTNDHEIT